MAKKHLPIQFFEKRKDYDDRSTEGGDNSAPPSWVLTGDALTAKSSALTSSVGDVITVFRERQSQEKKLPLVVPPWKKRQLRNPIAAKLRGYI